MKLRKICTLAFSLFSVVLSSLLPLSRISSPAVRRQTDSTSETGYVKDATEASSADKKFVVTMDSASYTTHSQSFTLTYKCGGLGTDKSYFLGYYSEKYYYPLTAVYNLVASDGSIKEVADVIDNTSTINPYEGIGPDIGSSSFTQRIDFVFEEGYTFDVESLKIYNIFGFKSENGVVTKEDGVYVPDIKDAYKVTTFTQKFKNNINLSSYFQSQLVGISTYGSYVSFNVAYNNNTVQLYQEENATVYNKNKDDIDSGKMIIVSDFPSLSSAYYLLEYQDGSKVRKDVSLNSQTNTQTISSGISYMNYLIEDVSIDNLKSFSLCGIALRIQIFNVLSDGTTKVKPSTSLNARLGCIYFTPSYKTMDNTPKTNIILNLVISFLIYTVILAGIILGLYYYRKNKYKNDEFRRVVPKLYFKTAGMAYVGGLIALLDILFIFYRAGGFNNVLTVFNPLDNFIVVLSILLIFVVGYAIKYLVKAFKSYQARREAIRLKLNEKNADNDDGTK